MPNPISQGELVIIGYALTLATSCVISIIYFIVYIIRNQLMARSIVPPGGSIGGFKEDGEEWPEVGRRFYFADGTPYDSRPGDDVYWNEQQRTWVINRDNTIYPLYAGKPPKAPVAEQPKRVRVLKCRDSKQ